MPLRPIAAALLVMLASRAGAAAVPEPPAAAAPAAQSETVEQALCRLIDSAAKRHKLPVAFFTRLIWQESSFRTGVVSPAGAQGVAQFMPGTARERGLADPFDPEQAIPHSASFLADLRARFGNLGLAAAAYNGGPNRVAGWLEGRGELAAETRSYVIRITGRTVDDWSAEAKAEAAAAPPQPEAATSCLQVTASLRRGPSRLAAPDMPEAPFAPWGVQLAGNFSKALALASFNRARQSYAKVLPDVRPMVIGTRMRSRGLRTYYRIRVPAQTRQAADTLCNRIRSVGGACAVLRS
jgi:Transglycosylase SLT domain/SPOR domain